MGINGYQLSNYESVLIKCYGLSIILQLLTSHHSLLWRKSAMKSSGGAAPEVCDFHEMESSCDIPNVEGWKKISVGFVFKKNGKLKTKNILSHGLTPYLPPLLSWRFRAHVPSLMAWETAQSQRVVPRGSMLSSQLWSTPWPNTAISWWRKTDTIFRVGHGNSSNGAQKNAKIQQKGLKEPKELRRMGSKQHRWDFNLNHQEAGFWPTSWWLVGGSTHLRNLYLTGFATASACRGFRPKDQNLWQTLP